MLISKRELCESLYRMSPRTFAYMNELEYPDLLLTIERHDISLPTSNQLQKAIQFGHYPLTHTHNLNKKNEEVFIKIKDEALKMNEEERLNFLQFYPSHQMHEMINAYSRMTKLNIKETKRPLKLPFPLDQDTLVKEMNIPQNNESAPVFLYVLQKLLSEMKRCDLKFSVHENILEIKYSNHIIKAFFNLHKNSKVIFPLQIFISAHCRHAPFIEQIESLSVFSSKELLSSMSKLLLLIFQLPETLTRLEYSLSQRNHTLAEKLSKKYK
ncbi:hypothetical protein [Staphylococcus caprae]